MLGEEISEVGAHRVAEYDRIGHLHHRGFQVHGEEHALLPRVGDLSCEKFLQSCAAHHGGVEHLALEDRDRLLEHGHRPVRRDVFDPDRAFVLDGDRLLSRAKVAVAHRRYVRARAP